MKGTREVTLQAAVTSFFSTHLPASMGVSGNTIGAYRDCFKLFLKFLCVRANRTVALLGWADAQPEAVLDFLDDLQRSRGNSHHTRNARLAALKTFYPFAASLDPALAELANRVAAIPFKRGPTYSPTFLSEAEVTAILDTADRKTVVGSRNYLAMALLYETGARASELLAIRPCDFRLDRAPFVRLHGKGNKTRVVPVSANCTSVVTSYLMQQRRLFDDATPLLRTVRGEAMGYGGLAALFAKARDEAASKVPSLRRSGITPHTFRHTKAMHLFQAGVSIVTIRDILGHASFATLHYYVQADVESKRRALETSGVKTKRPAFHRRPPDLLEWLESL